MRLVAMDKRRDSHSSRSPLLPRTPAIALRPGSGTASYSATSLISATFRISSRATVPKKKIATKGPPPDPVTSPVQTPQFAFAPHCSSPCEVCDDYFLYDTCSSDVRCGRLVNTGSPDQQSIRGAMNGGRRGNGGLKEGGGRGNGRVRGKMEGRGSEGGTTREEGKNGEDEIDSLNILLPNTDEGNDGESVGDEKRGGGGGGECNEDEEGVMVKFISSTSKMSLSQDSGGGERGNWQNKWDYFLSVAGFAIGLANVWRFPYLCFMNGGGAFLVPYMLTLALVGVPLYLLESALGQFSSSSCITLYNVCPILKGAGLTTFVLNLVFVTVYNVIIAYPLVFLGYSFTTSLPWASCHNEWNSERCSLADGRNFTGNNTLEDLPLSPADEFFHNKILELTDSMTELGGFNWPVVGASLFIWTFVFLCVFKGINVFGKVVWFTATFPFLMLFILMLRGITLPGAWQGLYFYLWPDFNKLKELKVWAAAASQIFYSLGPGWGILTTLGSYNKFRDRCVRNAVLVPLLNCFTSILAGFVVFSVLGFMAHRMNTTVDKVTAAGPSLVFITYPEALSLMPFSPLWSVLFFLMIFFLGIDSMIAHIENLTVSLLDEVPALRNWRGLVTFSVCLIDIFVSLLFCTRGGVYWLTLMDWYSATYTLILICLCEVAVFVFIYGAGRTVRDLQMMNNERINYLWYGAWLVVTPTVLLLIFVNTMMNNAPATYRGEVLPWWSQGIGWTVVAITMLPIPLYALYYIIFKAKGSCKKRLKDSITPTNSWGPALESHKEEWQSLCRQQPLRHRLLHPDLTLPPCQPQQEKEKGKGKRGRKGSLASPAMFDVAQV